MKATEMSDAKVARISLVTRAATRIPFRVIKQEKPMASKAFKSLDLASVFKREKPMVSPEILGVICMKSDGFEALKVQIAAAGFNVEKSEDMEDGSVVLAQADDVSGESTLVRISEDAVLAVKSFKPHMMDVTLSSGKTFEEVCKEEGFFPGLGSSMDILRGSVLTLAEKSEDQAETLASVKKMFDEASAYAASLITALPAKAFKLEFIETPEAPAKSQSADNEDATKVIPVVKMDFKTCAACKTEEACMKAGKCAGKEPAAKEDEVVVDPAKAEDKPDAALAAVTALASKMDDLLGKLSTAVAGVADTVSGLSTKVEAVEAVAKAAKDAVEGTVVLGSGDGDRSHARKSEVPARGREIDTGFRDPRQRR